MYFAHFSIDFSTYFLLIFGSCVYGLDTSHRVFLVGGGCLYWKYFSHSVLSFNSLNNDTEWTKALVLMYSWSIFFSLVASIFNILFKKSLSTSRSWRHQCMFSPKSAIAYLPHLDLQGIFAYDVGQSSSLSDWMLPPDLDVSRGIFTGRWGFQSMALGGYLFLCKHQPSW